MLSAKLRKSQGFTLIELLVVLAVLAVVVGAVVAAINPLQQINRANDGRAKNDIGSVATALQSYYTFNQTYPASTGSFSGDLAVLVPTELKALPTPANSNYTYTYSSASATGGACNAGTTACTKVAVYSALLAPKTAGSVWCWTGGGGVAREATSTACLAE